MRLTSFVFPFCLVPFRLPRHAVYPGVLAFYRELDLGTAGPDEWGPDRDHVSVL